MKLEEVAIQGFRSVHDTSLNELGRFNVLIGKNNTGKSNILSAIQMFFKVVATGDIIALNPPIGRKIDFYGDAESINLILRFRLSDEERAAIIRDILTEAQQMKNAAETLPQSLQLQARLVVQRKPKHFAYISELILKDIASPGQVGTTILKVSGETASELAYRQEGLNVSSRTASALKSVLERFGEDEWEQYKSEASVRTRSERVSQYPPLRYMLRHFFTEPGQENIEPIITECLREEKSYQGFRSAILSIIKTQDEERDSKWREPLKSTYTTFSGSDAQLPNYAANIAKMIGKIRTTLIPSSFGFGCKRRLYVNTSWQMPRAPAQR